MKPVDSAWADLNEKQSETYAAMSSTVSAEEPGLRGEIIYQGSSYGTGSSNNSYGAVDPTDIAYNPATGCYYMVEPEVDER